jgi:nicotinate-nucleotide adenylyltransferase
LKIGILGGTFDPIHAGHTYIARTICHIFGLDRIVFMVSKYPPHKNQTEISGAFHRYAMVVLNLLNERNCYASDRELRKSGPSYTIETLDELSKLHPDHQICFIAGSDSLQEIHLWREYDKLLLRHCLVFVQRPGVEVKLDKLSISAGHRDLIHSLDTQDVPTIERGRSYLLSLNSPPISSTQIRRMIATGVRPSAEYLFPPVYQYIRKYQLYGKQQRASEKSLRGN